MYEDSKALCSRRQNCVRVTSVLLQQDCTAQSMTTQTISFMQSPTGTAVLVQALEETCL